MRAGANRDDLVLTTAPGHHITIERYFALGPYGNAPFRVEEIRFADGTVWDYATILTRLSRGGAGDDMIVGVAGNDSLLGFGGNDTLDGGAGNDTLAGGDDVYRFACGDVQDQISGDHGHDVVVFGPGITAGDLRFHRANVTSDDLVVSLPPRHSSRLFRRRRTALPADRFYRGRSVAAQVRNWPGCDRPLNPDHSIGWSAIDGWFR